MAATQYQTANGAKPRYDGKGTEFGMLHRDLGPGYLMFDIDRLSVKLEEQLELRKENEGFVEYRLLRYYDNKIIFIAMIELKKQYTEESKKAVDMDEANSIARAEMCRRLSYDQEKPCRLFVVYATNGKQPFEFYEFIGEQFEFVGSLDYENSNRAEKVKDFWSNTLGINS